MLQKYGKDVVDDLEALEFEPKRWTKEELQSIKEYYRAKIKDIERGVAPTSPSTGMAVLDMFESVGETNTLPSSQDTT